MATIYTQTIQVSVWKEHVCACCGCRFRYRFRRTKKGTGGSPDAAAANAERAVVHALQREVDMQPCPGCGLYQPDMVAARRWAPHWIIAGVGVAMLGLVWILAAADVLSLGASAWTCAVFAAFILLAHLAVALLNPNMDRAANHAAAQDRLRAGRLWTPPNVPVNPNGVAPPTGLSWVGWALFGMMAFCVVAAAWPEILRGIKGWTVNKDWSPTVAGPGDSAYIYLPQRITSVKGYWNGSPQVTASVEGKPQAVLNLTADSKHDNWGNNITINNESTTSSSALWVRVKLPNDERLIEKTLKIHIQMVVAYPELQGYSSFNDTSTTVSHDAELTLSAAGAGASYRAGWYGGVLAGGLALTILGAMLALEAGSLRRLALPTEVFVPEKPTTY